MKLTLQHPGGRGSTTFEIKADGHEVWMKHPIRTQYGSSLWLSRFQPEEALAVAEALVNAAEAARAGSPQVE